MSKLYKHNLEVEKYLFWQEVIWQCKWYLKEVCTLCKQVFYRGPRNIVRWLPIIWEDEDWDYYQLLDIMEFKFRNMAMEHKNDPHHVNNERRARQLTVAAHLCNRLKTEDAYYNQRLPMYGDLRKQDKEMLGRLITKYLDRWWC